MLLLFFHTFSASLLFIYGIGLERLSCAVQSGKWFSKKLLVDYAVIVLCASSVRAAVYVLPSFLWFTVPLIAAVLFYGCEAGIQRLFEQKRTLPEEKMFNVALILFSVYHSATYTEMLTVIMSGIASLVIWGGIFCSIKNRVEAVNVQHRWKNTPLFLIGMGAAGLALYAWDSAWLTHVMF